MLLAMGKENASRNGAVQVPEFLPLIHLLRKFRLPSPAELQLA